MDFYKNKKVFWQFLNLTIFLSGILYFFPTKAEIVFEDNFDNISDWSNQSERESCAELNCSANAPGNFDFYNVDERWLPSTGYSNNPPTNQINSDHHRGVSGKAYTHYVESHDGAHSHDGWANDGMIGKYLGQEYQELWIEFYQKFQPGFQWRISPGSSHKNFRVYHWDQTGQVYDFGNDGNAGPMFMFLPGKNEYIDGKYEINRRCSPQDTNYYCSGDVSEYRDNLPFANGESFEEFIGDCNWHKYTFHIKMNSSPSATDGIFEFWIDNQLQRQITNYEWMYPGSNIRGWNVIQIGGNSNNIWTDEVNLAEQWYAVDDIVVSTEPIPDDYVIGGNQIRADVDNNSTINTTDAMLTLRNSLGLSMSGTNWFFSATTGDVNCDNVSNSTDAMLILRHSLGLDMTGTGWCE